VGLLRAADPTAFAAAPFTYAEVGATRAGPLPPGYDHADLAAVVGSGPAAFERAVAAVFAWGAQRALGLRVRATGPASEPGTVVVLTAGLRRLGYDIPCRVVWAQTSGPEQGFGYGTLPGHPESGEEAFVVEQQDDGAVLFRTRVFSRPATRLARLGGPVSRRVQHAALRRYVSGITAAARS
jgi:uncharacterized protein (UPF0548 family)